MKAVSLMSAGWAGLVLLWGAAAMAAAPAPAAAPVPLPVPARAPAAAPAPARTPAPAVAAPAASLSAASANADKDGRLRLQVFAQQQTVLSAELAAKVSRLTLKEGDRFNAGQVLVAFDCAIFQAQLNKAEAQLEAARQTLRVNKRLAELDSISKLEVDQADAKVKESMAEAASMRVVTGKCSLSAPFAGRVAKVHVDPYQYVAQGKPLLDIIDTRNPEVRMIMPSKWLGWVTKGTRLTVVVDDLGREYKARVSRIGARIDPVNQSVSLAAEVEGSPPELLPGMSGWAVFTVPK